MKEFKKDLTTPGAPPVDQPIKVEPKDCAFEESLVFGRAVSAPNVALRLTVGGGTELVLSPRAIKKFPVALLQTQKWAAVDTGSLRARGDHDPKYLRFQRCSEAMHALIQGASLREAAKIAELSSPRVLALLERCCSPSETGELLGYNALIYGHRIGSYQRKAAIRHQQGKATSYAGAFGKLLRDHPIVRERIDDAIANVKEHGQIKMHRASHQSVFMVMVQACRDEGLTDLEYPLCTKSVGTRALREYVKDRIAGKLQLVKEWYGESAARRLSLGTGRPDFIFGRKPFDVVHIDAHRMDSVSSVELQLANGQNFRVAIGRFWLIVVSDGSNSNAALGYSLACVDEIAAEHVEEALLSAMKPFKRRELYGGLKYQRDSCLPAGVIPGLDWCPIVMLKMDNALVHHSNRIRETFRQRFGIHLQFGPVGSPETNAQLERFFRTLEESWGIRRLPSSTGSGPQDPLRPRDFVRNAIEKEVDWRYVRDLIEVGITGYNATPSSALDNFSPRQKLELYFVHSAELPLVRCRTPRHPADPHEGCERFEVRIAGSVKKGARPYFEILGRRYSTEELANDGRYIGCVAVVYVDIRTSAIRAVYLNGRLLEKVFLKGRKEEKPMSLADRRAINREKDRRHIPQNMTKEDLLAEMTARATAQWSNEPYKINSAASELCEAMLRDFATQEAAAQADAPATRTEFIDVEARVVPTFPKPEQGVAAEADQLNSDDLCLASADPKPKAKPEPKSVDENDEDETWSNYPSISRLPGSRPPSFGSMRGEE